MKIYPRIDVISDPNTAITGPGSPWETATAPLSNLAVEDLTRPGRLVSKWWPKLWAQLLLPLNGYTSLEGFSLIGLSASPTTKVRLRHGDTLVPYSEELGPTSIVASTKVTAVAADMADDPDDSTVTITWPTYTGAASGEATSVRVALADPSGTVSDDNQPNAGGHPVRILTGLSGSGLCTCTVKLYESSVLTKTLGTFSVTKTIANGGQLNVVYISDDDVTDWDDVEIQVELPSPGANLYALCGAVRCRVDITDSVFGDSGWITVLPFELAAIGEGGYVDEITGQFRLAANWHYLWSSTFNALDTGTYLRIDLYDESSDLSATVSEHLPGDPDPSYDIGRVLGGIAEEVEHGTFLDGLRFGAQDDSVLVRSLAGQTFTQDGARSRRHRCELRYVTDTFRRTWAAYYDAIKGTSGALVVIPDETGSQATWYYDAIYGRMASLEPWTVLTQTSAGTYWTRGLEIEELVAD